MASRKVFCGARRPFITGIFTLMWDRQLLAEGHTIPGHSVWLLGGPRSSRMAPWGAAVRKCAPTGTLLHEIQSTAWRGWKDSSQHLRRQVQVQESSVVPDFREWISNSSVNKKQLSPGEGDRDQLFLFTFQWRSSSQWQHGGSLSPLHCRGGLC